MTDIGTFLGRPRFTIVHEAGHGILHRAQIRRQLSDGRLTMHRRACVAPYLDPEWQANTFASAVLTPAAMARQVAEERPAWQRVMTFQRVFDVSAQAAEVRLKTLGLF
jgi:Zn-dependent peptidase ImmA (M78 family)